MVSEELQRHLAGFTNAERQALLQLLKRAPNSGQVLKRSGSISRSRCR